jgi:beta-N-acetylhexosaminidase
MSLEQQIGAQLAVGFQGTTATPELIEQLARTQAQSLVLFSRNFVSSEQLVHLLEELEAGVGRRLLVMVDHEGGRIVRFRRTPALTEFPDALTVGRSQRLPQIEQQGRTEARELRALGIQVNLAPCVDVLAEGADPIIGDRSYGSDSALVTACAMARIRGLQDGKEKVAACAKHFPGLGAVPRDPHKRLPTITLKRWAMEPHWLPFQAAIEAGVATIMSSHVCYPGLGEPAGLPATFSPRLIHGLLRERFHFKGPILTDDLEMGALQAFGGIGEIAVRAVEAGHDLLLICSNLSWAEEALAGLKHAYTSKRLSRQGLEASLVRLKKLREFVGLSP